MNRVWIELDREALQNNINEYRRILPESCKLMAVVKADAYGHGAVPISKALVEMGVDFFAVASIDEAKILRHAGIKEDILVLGYTGPENFRDISEYNIIQTIPGAEYGILLQSYCKMTHTKVRAHVAIDSGMHRIGYTHDENDELVKLYDQSELQIEGIFTHLCVANEDSPESIDYSNKQIDYFYNIVDMLRKNGIDHGCIHLMSSFAAINYKDRVGDYARIGLLMFGNKTEDSDYLAEEFNLKPVLSLKTHIISLRWIDEGETVSYGRWFTAKRPTLIATLPLGYADGIPRNLSNGNMRVIINGKYAYGAGRICMDQMMVDVTDIPDVKMGDVVTLIGKDGDLEIRAEEVAEHAGTITHELFARLGTRIERPKSI